MQVLGIESTCDETSASVAKDGKEILSNVVASQIKDHRDWQGVVPEIAARLHLKKIIPIIDEAVRTAGIELTDIDLIAASNRPGLIGGLVIGVSVAKALAFTLGKPYIGVNHIEGHLYSPHITNEIEFPYVGLLISGGHTLLVVAKNYTEYEVVGTTIDDAVGEAFDKIAKYYDIGYPGGPAVEKAALNGNEKAFDFPISNLYKSDRKFDFSYSGLKTAVINHLQKYKKVDTWTVNDIAASFQKRAFDILYKKTELVSSAYGINRVVVAGGVSANKYLRRKFAAMPEREVYFPDLKYSTDNGAMIASFAYQKFLIEGETPLDSSVYPRVPGFKISLEDGYR